MFELKPLSPDAVPAALAKAEHYRLLNEPEEAESICIDILEVDPEHQQALINLLLARTDQFQEGSPSLLKQAREVLPRLKREYDRAYYGGLICERQAKTLLRRRGTRSGFVAYEWFQYALEQYELAIASRPTDAGDATLRWNACVRMIERHPHCAPEPEERAELGLE
ncbi:MAG: hypothetical protein IIB36_11300 [Gemmatimonadetes bacterium]|nr:hypothetical protein [Gemmatimonadota bacterium]